MEREQRADVLRAYHHTKPILVLPNAWDVASAKRLAAVPGCRALATRARRSHVPSGMQTASRRRRRRCSTWRRGLWLPSTYL
jgi:PEP phosphonomutase and related enzymes